MRKTLVLLAVGIAIGYWFGFRDAQVHNDNVVVRLVHRTGGPHRAGFNNDIDSRMDSLTQ